MIEFSAADGAAALARIAAIEASTRWRLTAPLRRTIDLARGRRRPVQ